MSIPDQSADSTATALDSERYILQLETELAERKRSEKLQYALYKIASIDYGNGNLDSFYEQVHRIIDELIYAKNFFIALYNEEDASLNTPYFIDEKDEIELLGKKWPVGKGISSYVLRTRKAQLLDIDKINELIAEGAIDNILGSSDFYSWMGAPMISANYLHGLIIVQSYDKNIIYNNDDLQLLNFVAQHIANAIETVQNTLQREESQVKMALQHRLLEQKNADLNYAIEQLKSTQRTLVQKEKMAYGDITPRGFCSGCALPILSAAMKPIAVCVGH